MVTAALMALPTGTQAASATATGSASLSGTAMPVATSFQTQLVAIRRVAVALRRQYRSHSRLHKRTRITLYIYAVSVVNGDDRRVTLLSFTRHVLY